MSENGQRAARERREAALERERAARERGDDGAAERQQKAADADGRAAGADEALRVADVAVDGERIGEPAPGVRRPDPDSTPGEGGDGRAPSTAELDALIDEALDHAAAVAHAAHDAAEMAIEIVDELAALLQERARSADFDAAGRRDAAAADAPLDVLPADVLEIVALDAHAGGVSLADYLRDAVLSSRAGSQDGGGGALEAHLRAARSKAARLLAENRAVQAQNAQVTRRHSRASAANRPHSGAPRRQQGGNEPDSHER